MLGKGPDSPAFSLFAFQEGVGHNMPPAHGVLEVTDQEQAWTGPLGRASKFHGGPGTKEQENCPWAGCLERPGVP